MSKMGDRLSKHPPGWLKTADAAASLHAGTADFHHYAKRNGCRFWTTGIPCDGYYWHPDDVHKARWSYGRSGREAAAVEAKDGGNANHQP